ncbi:hypothetical protein F2Q70_00025935 [Brassica cretica]|uniref:Uncharacterized protein n=1 Tax=Brassica cretica TaxID=69181 RepID=A0A8S9L865_BRACR|nr:hypothetical protein F2Q70_00025935 [Brassica cretica]
MDFSIGYFSKARILKLSEDLGLVGTQLVRSERPAALDDRPAYVLILTAFDLAGSDASGQKPNELVLFLGESYPRKHLSNSLVLPFSNLRATLQSIWFSIRSSYPDLIHSSEPILGSFKWYQSRSFGTMSSDDERNRPGNSVAGLSNLQMRALNDSMSNMLNAGLDQIHQRLDEILAS